MEAKTTLKAIPYGDRFCVQELWVWETVPVGVMLKVTFEVAFSKSCPFESQIQTKSLSTMRDTLEAWSVMAKRALAKSQRREAAATTTTTTVEEIEVTYQNDKTRVLGEEEEEEEEDWEMDPTPATPSKRIRRLRFRWMRRKRKASIQ